MKDTPILDTSFHDFLVLSRDRLIDKLRLLDEQIGDERASLVFQKYGVKVGSIVRSRGNLYRVTEIETRYWPSAWPRGNPQRKDGTYCTVTHSLLDGWELVE